MQFVDYQYIILNGFRLRWVFQNSVLRISAKGTAQSNSGCKDMSSQVIWLRCWERTVRLILEFVLKIPDAINALLDRGHFASTNE